MPRQDSRHSLRVDVSWAPGATSGRTDVPAPERPCYGAGGVVAQTSWVHPEGWCSAAPERLWLSPNDATSNQVSPTLNAGWRGCRRRGAGRWSRWIESQRRDREASRQNAGMEPSIPNSDDEGLVGQRERTREVHGIGTPE